MLTGDQTTTVTPDPESMAPGPGDDLYVTLDPGENYVYELVLANDQGMFTRENGQWIKIDPDADNPRIWDCTIRDVKPDDGIKGFDDIEASDGTVSVARMEPYLAPEGAEA